MVLLVLLQIALINVLLASIRRVVLLHALLVEVDNTVARRQLRVFHVLLVIIPLLHHPAVHA
jgi:hypothetical protein